MEEAEASCLAKLSEWRERQPPSLFLSDATLRRYAVANKLDSAAAERGLIATLAWRETALAPPLRCALCAKDATAHAFFPVGVDEASNVVVFGSPAWATNSAVEPTVSHVVQTLEHAWNALPGVQWTWVVSFKGFGFAHAMNARLGISFASVFAAHHPERLRHLLLLDPPTVFEILLAAVRPFADARTMSKIAVVRGDDISGALGKAGIVDPEMIRWVQLAHAAASRPRELALPAAALPLQLSDSALRAASASPPLA